MIELLGMSTRYGTRTVLHDITTHFEAGQLTCIIGRNGSGKSTLLKAMIGLVDHTGTILIDGKDLCDLSHRKRARHIAYLPQSGIAARMDAMTLVSHGRYARLGPSRVLSAVDRSAIYDAMVLTDTWDLRYRMIFSLSGGERARVALAMVIAQDTPYILLDEPCAALDVSHRIQVLELLRKLADEKRAIVVSSHDLQAGFSVASDIVLLKDGALVAQGSPQDMLNMPDVMRDALGVSLVHLRGTSLLYPYALAR